MSIKSNLLSAVAETYTQINAAENALGRGLYRLEKLEKLILGMVEEVPVPPEPTPVPPIPPEPTPIPPTPVPPTPIPPAVRGTVMIDGITLQPTPGPSFITPTGLWPVDFLGPVAEGYAYIIRYALKPEYACILILREGKLTPDNNDLDERIYQVSANLEGRAPWTASLSIFPGAGKVTKNGEAILPTMQRLQEAVAAHRILPYSADAFTNWMKVPVFQPDKNHFSTYIPDRAFGRSTSNNAIGIVSGQGGEYGSSRGFISQDDAVMLAAALRGDQRTFDLASIRNHEQMLYSLSLPYLCIWSFAHHQPRDPQIPFAGDNRYHLEGSNAGSDAYPSNMTYTFPPNYKYATELGVQAGVGHAQQRDASHLLNHGFVYWLATGDPLAAILLQSTAAYAMASTWPGGAESDGSYKPTFVSQRKTFNVQRQAYILSDIATNADGGLLWSTSRGKKMVEDLTENWKKKIDKMDAATDVYSRSSSIFRGLDLNRDNAYSNFMIQGYMPDAAYMLSFIGKPYTLRRCAENFILRFGKIGGTRGFYGKGSGSGFGILAKGAMPYTDEASFIEWINTATHYSNTTFNGSPPHSVFRGYWTLKLAQDAIKRGRLDPLPGLEEAIAKTEQCRDATTEWASNVSGWKLAGIPFTD